MNKKILAWEPETARYFHQTSVPELQIILAVYRPGAGSGAGNLFFVDQYVLQVKKERKLLKDYGFQYQSETLEFKTDVLNSDQLTVLLEEYEELSLPVAAELIKQFRAAAMECLQIGRKLHWDCKTYEQGKLF